MGQEKISIAVITCVYKRADVFELFLKNFLAVRRQVSADFDLHLYVAGSVTDDFSVFGVFNKYAADNDCIHWHEHPNLPLGAKWNSLLPLVKNFDFVLVVGSDDIFNAAIFNIYKDYIGKGAQYIGMLDGYFYDLLTDRMLFWSGYTGARRGEPFGAGRMVSMEQIKRNGYQLWDNHLNKGLDLGMQRRLYGCYREMLHSHSTGIIVADIKSDQYINAFNAFSGFRMSPRMLMEFEIYADIVRLHEDYKTKILQGKVIIPMFRRSQRIL